LLFFDLISDVQQTAVVTSTIRKKATSPAGPNITVTVNDSPKVPKKRPSKLTLSQRFASETVAQPKVSHITMGGSEATDKSTVKKNNPSPKLIPTNKGKNNKCNTLQVQIYSRSYFF
jgi:hypothetical protein